jgi:hypothetical protein
MLLHGTYDDDSTGADVHGSGIAVVSVVSAPEKEMNGALSGLGA